METILSDHGWRAMVAQKQYPPGTRIRLLEMEDPFAPIPPGACGTVECVDAIGQLHMKWDDGRSLAVVPGEDSFEVLSRPARARKKGGDAR